MPGIETFIGSKLKGPVQKLLKWQAGLECVDADAKKEDFESHQIVVHDDRMYFRIIYKGAIAFGEAYMDGDWEPAESLFEVLKCVEIEAHSFVAHREARIALIIWSNFQQNIRGRSDRTLDYRAGRALPG